MSTQVLILTGDGINCENETRLSCLDVGLSCEVLQVNDLLRQPSALHDYQCLIVPGGFSFGDDLGSGKIFARKMARKLSTEIEQFIADKKLILGICNGFQVLATLGLFNSEEVAVALDENVSGHFMNRWEDVLFHDSRCLWTRGLTTMTLPIRHGEGRVVFSQVKELPIDQQYQLMKERGQVVLSYRRDVNGSYENIAGLCDESGQVFGLMPHPEAARTKSLYPGSHQEESGEDENIGLALFANMKNYLSETFP